MNAATRPFLVLLVDDDPGDVLLIEEALESMQVPRVVHVANDGEEAVAVLRQSGRFSQAPRPDVVLLDLNMPRMNGHQVMTEVQADPGLRTIPIVMLTTSQAPGDVLKSYSLHANAYITKPMNLDDLGRHPSDRQLLHPHGAVALNQANSPSGAGLYSRSAHDGTPDQEVRSGCRTDRTAAPLT